MPTSSDPIRRMPIFALAAALTLSLTPGVPALAQGQSRGQTQNQPPLAGLIPQGAPPSFADLAATQENAVVFISSTQAAARSASPGPRRGEDLPEFPPGLPFEQFFRNFRDRQHDQQRPSAPTMALGSGFIIDPAGYVVTNNHVVTDAAEISVTLHDGRKLMARVVGVDGPTDLALLKVDSDGPLTAATWGDSDRIRIGDWVVAIGNPFGLGGTVTAGILSARARDIQQGPYDDYLQTDASINRGNSGGPLYDLDGSVIGINTAIYSPTGGSVGIGFAIPSRIARPVIEQLRDHGKVRRGWLGVQVQRVTPDIAESLGMPEPKGALVTSISPESPAGGAGVRQGDIITAFDGKDIDRMRELPRIVAATEIGRKVPLDILRAGHKETLTVRVGELEEQRIAAAGSSGEPEATPPAETDKTVLGLKLSSLTPGLREAFSIGDDVSGVVVTDVGGGGPATERGIEAGDVIVEAGQEPVSSPEDLDRRIQQARGQGRKTVLMLISRAGDLRYVPLPIEDRKG